MNEKHFEFGQNWSEYSKLIEDEKFEAAKTAITGLLAPENWKNKSVLDIGSGSGIHSAAISTLGVARLVSVDYDINSVNTTIATLDRFGSGNIEREIFQDDILNSKIDERFDIVYSWGVLHHTGSMWDAISNASKLVKPDGHFIIAIYKKTTFCGTWKKIKKRYTYSPRAAQKAMEAFFYFFYLPTRLVGRKNVRGMNWWVDVKDWIGGYPYESASTEEIVKFVEDKGFKLVLNKQIHPKLGGFFSTGCEEYVFQRTT